MSKLEQLTGLSATELVSELVVFCCIIALLWLSALFS